jgi:uncharacterized protein (UPF0332 family)
MSLEELLRSKIIRRIKPNHSLALKALKRARRDIDTAKTLMSNKKFDWALAVSYNAMLTAGRALMFYKGFRPSSTEGHLAVVKFLNVVLKNEAGSRMVLVMNGMRKKRHRIVYEEMDVISKSEAHQAIIWAEEFVDVVTEIVHEASRKEKLKRNEP